MALAFGRLENPNPMNPTMGRPIQANAGGFNPQSYRDQAMRRLAFSLDGPYSDQWQQSQINRNADALAKSSEQQMEQLRADASSRGLAFNDPSLQAEQRRISEGRRTAAIGMAGDVRREAAGANWQGGMQAANTLLNQTSPYAVGGGSYTSYQPHVRGGGGLAFTPKSSWRYGSTKL